MGTLRFSESQWNQVRSHLFSAPGEHFAFMLANHAESMGAPVFLVQDVIPVHDRHARLERGGWSLSPEGYLLGINAAVRSGLALIEAHNHGGMSPRPSATDQRGLEEFVPYVLSSVPGRPYAATVWGDEEVYGDYFAPSGTTGVIKSVTVVGDRFRQVASVDGASVSSAFDRQLPWFTEAGQRALGRIRVGIVGAGGTGSPLVLNLVHLGIRDFAIVEPDAADPTSMNRLVTASAADVESPKAILARRRIRSVAPDARVIALQKDVRSPEALDALRGVDVVFGCVDNDGARLVLNELAVAYAIPYFDLAAGLDAEEGRVNEAGGRVAVVVPDGPCLLCMGEIDSSEAHFFLSSPEERRWQVAHGYVRGLVEPSPAVAPLCMAIAAAAAAEFAVLFSGIRPLNCFTELDLLRNPAGVACQSVAKRHVKVDTGCIHHLVARKAGAASVERYAEALEPAHIVGRGTSYRP